MFLRNLVFRSIVRSMTKISNMLPKLIQNQSIWRFRVAFYYNFMYALVTSRTIPVRDNGVNIQGEYFFSKKYRFTQRMSKIARFHFHHFQTTEMNYPALVEDRKFWTFLKILIFLYFLSNLENKCVCIIVSKPSNIMVLIWI